MASIELEPDFTGPAHSGQGGIAAGLLAAHLEGPTRVRLHRPPPLARPLEVVAAGEGVEARDGDETVLSATAGTVSVEPPHVSRAEAAATEMELEHHFAPHCIVCGPRHPRSLRVFPGPVADRGVRATVWRPPDWVADASGAVRPEMLWGVLDCPGSIASGDTAPAESFPALGTFTVELRRPVVAGEEVVVVGWPLSVEGRKLRAAAAIVSLDGEVHALAEHVCIAMPLTWSS